jgi:hypothetical protein
MPSLAPTSADATLGKLTLRVRPPKGAAQTVVLTSGCCRIGSGEGCTLRLRAPGIRDVHCAILREPRRTTVRGLAKETWLNGAAFFESPLAVGDCLRLGRLEIDVLGDERLAVEPSEFVENIGADRHAENERPSSAEASAHEPSADAASESPSEPASHPVEHADYTQQLKELVASQTAALGATWSATVESQLGDLRQELSRHQTEFARYQAGIDDAQLQTAGNVKAALDRLSALEDRTPQAQKQQDLAADSAGGERTAAAAPWQDIDNRLAAIDRLLERQAHENDARWRQLDETRSQLAEIATVVTGLQDAVTSLNALRAETPTLLDELRREHEDQWAVARADEQRMNERRAAEQLASEERLANLEAELNKLRQAPRDCAAAQSSSQHVESQPAERTTTHLVSPEERRAWLAAAGQQAREASDTEGPPPDSNENPSSYAGTSDEPQEVTFEPVSKAAPLSTLDVLRRMGASIDLSNAEESGETPAPGVPARPMPAPSPPGSSRSLAAPRHGQPSAHEQGDDGESIENYMSGLLQRLRTGKAEGPERNTISTAPAQRPSTPLTAERPPGVEKPKPVPSTTKEFVPRALPPELTTDLSAMRALANNTARRAIDMHQRRGQVRATKGKLLIAGVALVISIALMWFSTGGNRLALLASVLSLLVSAYWIRRYVLLTRKTRSSGKEASDGAEAKKAQPQDREQQSHAPVEAP